MSTGKHVSKVSYFGDPTKFEFPSSEESLVLKEDYENCSPSKIERVGSVFIKSGICKVAPFPTFENYKQERIGKSDNTEERKEEEIDDGEENYDSGVITNDTLDSDKLCVQEGDTSNSTNEQVEALQQLGEPFEHSKKINDGSIKSIKRKSTNRKYQRHYTTSVDIDEIEVPRRSSKRLMRVKSSLKRKPISRKNSIYSEKNNSNKLNKNSIHVLASEVRKSIHSHEDNDNFTNNKTKNNSINFSALDKLLDQLLIENKSLSDSSSISKTSSYSSPLTTTSSQASSSVSTNDNSIYSNSENEDTTKTLSDEESKTSELNIAGMIKPFDIQKSVSRKSSIKRSLSNINKEFKSDNKEFKNDKKENSLLPEIKEYNNAEEDKCELKRSNAIKRRNIFIESIINIINIIKRGVKKIFRVGSMKRDYVSFNNNNTNNKMHRRNESIKNKKIGEPVLIDINKTPFKSHMLNTSTKMRTIPIVKKVNESVQTLRPIYARKLSPIQSIDEETSNEDMNNKKKRNEKEDNICDEEFLMLWKHYLSKSIANRIEMKIDINKINQMERVKSIQSNNYRRKSVKKNEINEIEKLMDKYIYNPSSANQSEISSVCSTMNMFGLNGIIKKNEDMKNSMTLRDNFATSTSSLSSLSSFNEKFKLSGNSSSYNSSSNNTTSNSNYNKSDSIYEDARESPNRGLSVSTGWSTINEDEQVVDEGMSGSESELSSSSMSTIEEFVDVNSSDSSISTIEEEDVFQQYSIISEAIEERDAEINELETSSTIKSSPRVMDLTRILQNGNNCVSDINSNPGILRNASNGGDRRSLVVSDAVNRLSTYSQVSRQSSMSTRECWSSDAFSFQPSEVAV